MLTNYLVLAAEQLLHGKFDQVDVWFNGPSTWIFPWSYSSATNLVLMLCKIRRSRRLSTLQSLDPSALTTYCTTEWPTGKCLIFVLMHLYGMYMYISFVQYMYICTSWEHMISSIVFCNDISVCLFVCILFLGHVALWHIIWDIILLFIDVTAV